MNNKKVKQIVKFSLQRNIQNKWFVILNCFLLILVIIGVNSKNIDKLLEKKDIDLFNHKSAILYIDKENLLGNSLDKAFKEYDGIEVEKIEVNNFNENNIDKNIVIEIIPSEKNILEAKIISKEGINGKVYNIIIETLEKKRLDIFSLKNNIEKEDLKILEEDIPIERLMLGVDNENSDKKEIIEYVTTMIVYLISIFIFSKI